MENMKELKKSGRDTEGKGGRGLVFMGGFFHHEGSKGTKVHEEKIRKKRRKREEKS
jgi:hypothetical protein